jgi:hypothetical protein
MISVSFEELFEILFEICFDNGGRFFSGAGGGVCCVLA